jgi:uncharacterized protein with HEPN domain
MIRDESVYLHHILDAINRIEEYASGLNHEGFMRSSLVQDGVIRQVEIIGEATKNLSPSLKERYAEIPWKDIAGMRDKLIHQYFGVDISAVWETVVQDLPDFKIQIGRILSSVS